MKTHGTGRGGHHTPVTSKGVSPWLYLFGQQFFNPELECLWEDALEDPGSSVPLTVPLWLIRGWTLSTCSLKFGPKVQSIKWEGKGRNTCDRKEVQEGPTEKGAWDLEKDKRFKGFDHSPSDLTQAFFVKSLGSGPRIEQRERSEPFIPGRCALGQAVVTPFSPGQARGTGPAGDAVHAP